MLNKIKEIRVSVNNIKASLYNINIDIENVTLKYIDNKIGVKEYRKQLGRLLKEKNILIEQIDMKICEVEEIESQFINGSNKILKIVPEVV